MTPDDEDGDDPRPPRPGAEPPGGDLAGDLIGRNLRRLFRDVEQEALPDRLQTLLKRLEDEERGGS